MKLLTKSKYLIGMKCPKHMWMLINKKKEIPEFNIFTKFIFNQGNEVGKLAQKIYPDGKNIPIEDFIFNLKASSEYLEYKIPLFEAGFKYHNCFSRADILVPVGNKWNIIEVKSGTNVKNENLHDVSFQKFCYEGNGIKINKCFLMHLNSNYILDGNVNIKKLFVKKDITDKVNELMKDVVERIEYFSNIINNKKYILDESPKCKCPKNCKLNLCWNFLPNNNVFELYNGKEKSIELFKKNIFNIKDIPNDEKLTPRQFIQKKCSNGKVHYEMEKIKEFLYNLKKPINYLDFETFSTAIPIFQKTKPYSNICFQYSLHIENKHFEYLYNGNKDPRKEFILSLKKNIGKEGSIVVYNKNFEISRLKELGYLFPEYKKFIKDIINRVVDLSTIFTNFHYYNSKQKGSASIKNILPIFSDKKYSDLNINDGSTASVMFFYSHYKNIGNKEKIRKDLLEYCKLDTQAEIDIIKKLRKLVNFN